MLARHCRAFKSLQDATELASLSARAVNVLGLSNYYIFLHPETRQLFRYAGIDSEEQWAAIASTEICQRWWKHMGNVMPSNPDHSPVSTPLREVFHLN